MKYEVATHGTRLEAIGAHSGYRIRMSTVATLPEGLHDFPLSVFVRGSESEPEVQVDLPKRHLADPTEAFEHGFDSATLWIDAQDKRLSY